MERRFYERLEHGWRMMSACILLLAMLVGTPVAYAYDLPVTSHFGWRWHPISGEWKFHAGVDLGYEYGTPVPALFQGTVTACGDFGDGYGNQIVLYHESFDAYTRYAHLMSIYVSVNDYVAAGTVIGAVGSTGYSTGPHLHLEYIARGESGEYEYFDPLILWEN